MHFVKKLLSPLQFLLCLFINKLAKKNSCNVNDGETKSIAIIKLDSIGDYVLFRNFLKVIKKSKKYKGYQITLIGNQLWKDLALNFDKKCVEKFIWVNINKFNVNLIYRYSVLTTIKKRHYNLAVNPTYSRTFLKDDSIIDVINAPIKIGSTGDLSNISKWQKGISDNYYNKLLSAENGTIFEFYRYKKFFKRLLKEDLGLLKPKINLENRKKIVEGKYIIIFPGAGSKNRRWSPSKFAELIKYILKNYNKYKIIIAGSKDDSIIAKEIIIGIDENKNVINTTGKISLTDLAYLIANAQLLISNETCAVHLAATLNTKTICISNGNHYKRFNPYPKHLTNQIKYIYPQNFKSFLDTKNRSKINTEVIPVNKVIKEIQRNHL